VADSPTPDDHPAPVSIAIAEDVEDLKAQIAALRTMVQALTEAAEADDTAGAGDSEAPDDAEESEEQDDGEGEEEWQSPPFILLLEGEQYQDELRGLAEWVEGVLVPGMLGEATHDSRWCHLWLEHDAPVIGPLHALWLAWQELTDPTTCGYTGPSVWYRDHYRPCMAELRSSTGPFAGCTKGEHQIVHRLPGRVPSAWYMDAGGDE
jgi:hypothetical protein